MRGYDSSRVSPFGHPRMNGCLRLPEAFRSLPRPSSLPGAKASTLRPLLLDFYFQRPATCTGPLVLERPSVRAAFRPSTFRAGSAAAALPFPPSLVKDPPGQAAPLQPAFNTSLERRWTKAWCYPSSFLQSIVLPCLLPVPSLLLVPALLPSGGEYRDRTGDLLLAKQALSQLS